MRFLETPFEGAFILELELIEDERGFFARSYCESEFKAHDLCSEFPQHSISYNKSRGTLRGLHYQMPPHEEIKIVRCFRGSIFDVIVDVRPESQTLGRCFSLELSEVNRRALYIPKGFAHGFLSLEEETTLFYQISCDHAPKSARSIRWNDPELNIPWPRMDVLVLSEKDRNAPLLKERHD